MALNNRLVNRVAWRWLKEVEASAPQHKLHLLTLAQWGLENGAEGDWPEDLADAVEMHVGDLALCRAVSEILGAAYELWGVIWRRTSKRQSPTLELPLNRLCGAAFG